MLHHPNFIYGDRSSLPCFFLALFFHIKIAGIPAWLFIPRTNGICRWPFPRWALDIHAASSSLTSKRVGCVMRNNNG